jgi:DNA-binding MarR family transcriptional regulator
MSKKEIFIEDVEKFIDQLSEEGKEYFEELKTTKGKTEITEKGKIILKYIQDNFEKYNNVFKAKDIGDAIGISGRSVSGSIKKLITDGYVEKIGANPVTYGITELGKNYILD